MKTSDLRLPEGVSFHRGDTPEAVAAALAAAVSVFLKGRLEQADRASLVVSGGSTPVPFFRALAEAELAWSRVDILLADERWVPETDPASNTALVRRHLLRSRAAEANYIPLKSAAGTPEQGLEPVQRALASLPLPIDVLVLGMGQDGHTASLFPDAPELPLAMDPETEQRVAAMTPASQPQRRVTLTLPVLRQARFLALHLRGRDKLDTLARACAQPEDIMSMPVRAFLRPGLQIYWSP